MRGRPRSFDKSIAVSSLVEVFWNHGYDATSIDDLQVSIGVKRGSFYAAFGDKESVYLLVLERYLQTITARRLDVLTQADKPRAGLAAFLRELGVFLSSNRGRGCLLLTAIAQMPTLTPSTASALTIASTEFLDIIRRAARNAVHAEEKVPQRSADALAAFVVSQILGLNAMARRGESAKTIQAAADTAAAFLHPPV
jgi:TetR/AcrR family transcriptional repressor of nem operon